MNNLLLIMSTCCFIPNLYGLIATWTGVGTFGVLFIKVIALFGTLCPILYWLKLLNII